MSLGARHSPSATTPAKGAATPEHPKKGLARIEETTTRLYQLGYPETTFRGQVSNLLFRGSTVQCSLFCIQPETLHITQVHCYHGTMSKTAYLAAIF